MHRNYTSTIDKTNKMVKYKCGHNTDGVIILDSNELSMTAYLVWKDSIGLDGDKSKCWECCCSSND